MTLSEQRKESMYKYAKEKLKRIPLDVQKAKYDEIKVAADKAGESVNGYIKKAIDEKMDRDSYGVPTSTPINTKEQLLERLEHHQQATVAPVQESTPTVDINTRLSELRSEFVDQE